jgi:hypothetical protein
MFACMQSSSGLVVLANGAFKITLIYNAKQTLKYEGTGEVLVVGVPVRSTGGCLPNLPDQSLVEAGDVSCKPERCSGGSHWWPAQL